MKNNVLLSFFGDLKDKRSHVNKLHSLESILLIGITSVICGAQTWKQMEEFAKDKIKSLEKIMNFPNGIPSDDTINRVFSAIDTKEFERCFVNWTTSLMQPNVNQVISIDGKTARGAKSHGEPSPVHIVSAWASENNIVAGQVKVNEKSNEITAIPELLDLLFIEGDVVTIDAMGTQTEIAKKIIEKGADYILAVKDNQKELHSQIKEEFLFAKQVDTVEDVDFGHGRIETRKCSIVTDFQFIENNNNKWRNLNTIIKIESIRDFKNSDKPKETAVRYFISSIKEQSSAKLLDYTRSHWAIENKLHWILDVQFGEDKSRKRNENAAQNYSIVMKIALNLLKNENTVKQGKRLKAAWNEEYLWKVLNIKV